jgi:manganese oxidase
VTDFLIRTVSRYPLRRLARPSAVLGFALALAYGGGFWETLLHHLEGGHERNQPGLVLHWLRDATVALPLVCAAVWAGFLLARRLIERHRLEHSPRLAGATLAATVAWVDSMVVGLASPLHNTLFAAGHGGAESFYLIHAGRDALLALAVNLPLALAVCAALLRRTPWAAPLVAAWRAPRSPGRRFALQGALALVVVAPIALVANAGTYSAIAGAGPGTPCPSSAPLKTFDVTAIDVDIPLNRFGGHDPLGKMYALTSQIPRIREAERTQHVSIGEHENDPIQPLVIRANLGDCVQIRFTNDASGGEYGMHIDGLAYDIASSGDAVGFNPSSAVARGETRTYRYWIPREPESEGGHYIRPGPGNREQVAHGLFGSLVAEPPGSTYLDMNTGEPLASGWEATIVPGDGQKAFREYNLLHHEVGDEKYDIPDGHGGTYPRVDPHTEAYRPGSRAMNYRSEPFMLRLDRAADDSHGYGSYTFADPATPTPRGYLGDPTKIRIMHAGSESFHVYHLHGGSIRWRLNPHADHTYDYAETGLDKHPKKVNSPSSRLDSQEIGPGESYDLEIEGGAGGLQQGAGEFLFHCHIAKHYVGGMWAFWRVFDTLQPDLEPLPDRAPLPKAVDSTQLIGKTINGSTLTRDNLDQWIKPQLPAQGKRLDDQDGAVWDYQVQDTPNGPLYLGEPEDKSSWADFKNAADDPRFKLEGHPSLMPVDQPVGAEDRPKILFNPINGRPAFPLLRPHVGMRPPFSPNGHSGAPYLGETADAPKTAAVDPWANRRDGICPSDVTTTRHYNIVGTDVDTPVTANADGSAKAVDPQGKIFVLAHNLPGVLNGTKPAEPLAIRANIGDCVAVTLTSNMEDAKAFGGHSKVNLHIHHVQFDTQASDGVISGMSFEQSVRPFKAEDVQLSADVPAGAASIQVINPDPARPVRLDKFREGVSVAVGEGTDDIEIRQIASVERDPATPNQATVTFTSTLNKAHPAGQWSGTEFVQSRWYPDVALDNVFWHDHVDGIHTWGHGLVGQLLVEPPGSTYHDPVTGAENDGSGTYVDIHTPNPAVPGLVDSSFRELALWTIDENPVTDSTLNLRAAPLSDRLAGGSDPSLAFSSYRHGDPNTPLPRAYPGDPFVIRTINVSANMDTIHVDGHRFFFENRYLGPTGQVESTPTDTIHYGVSEKYTLALDGGAGGLRKAPGDYLYFNGLGRRLRQGAWGIIRVLPQRVGDLAQLPGTSVPAGDGSSPLPAVTGGAPPEPRSPGQPCPASAPQRNITVSAVDVPGGVPGREAAFVPSFDAAAVKSGARPPEPLVVHAAAGECLNVTLNNERASARASFHVGELTRTPESSGVDVGFNPEQTVAPGGQRTYRFYADSRKIGSALISDFGGFDTGAQGLYGSVVVAPANATFTDPVSGEETSFGTAVDVHVPGTPGYRDFSAIMSDDDPIIGGSFMPYPSQVSGQALINYRSAGQRADDSSMFSSRVHGDPATPVFRAYAGDPTKVHFTVAPGSEQLHVFSLGGQFWPFDPEIANSQAQASQAVGAWQTFDAEVRGGAGGLMRTVGDSFYGDLRRPFTQAGMWGLMRVMSDPSCPIRPLDGGLGCTAQPSSITDPPPVVRPGEPAPGAFEGGAGNTPVTGGPSPVTAGSQPTVSGVVTAGATKDVRSLRVARRLSLRKLASRGLRLRMQTPRNTRVIRVTLSRKGAKRRRPALTGVLRVRHGGRVSVRWKPGVRAVRRLRRGTYVLRVRVGRDRRHLSRQVEEATLRLTGLRPRIPANSARRRR